MDSLPAEPPGNPKNTWVGRLSLLQWIFPSQELNQGLLHCRWIFLPAELPGKPIMKPQAYSDRTFDLKVYKGDCIGFQAEGTDYYNKVLQCVRVGPFPDVDFSYFHSNWIPQYSLGTRLPKTKAFPISATFLPVCFKKKYSYREIALHISLISAHYCCVPSWTLNRYAMKVKHRESIKQKNLHLWHHGSFTYLTWTMYSFWVST